MLTNSIPKKYRIGIDARFYRSATGGIGRYSRELIEHLSKIDSVNDYIVFITEADLPEWHCDNPNFTPEVVPYAHYTVQEQTGFLKVLLKHNLDLVHFLNFNYPVLYTRPFVVTIHDLTLYHRPDSTGKSAKSAARHAVLKAIMKRVSHAAKRVIAVSEHTATDLEKNLKVSPAKVEVILEGGPIPQQLPFGSKKLVHDYLGTKDPYILFVSQWREHKGILTLLQAFAELKERTGIPHKLVILGKQDKAPEDIKEALANSPVASEIITPGFAPDELLPALYSYASVFTMPSEYEGFGLPVLEALTYGVPTVVADNSSLPEVGGNAVLYFPTKESSKLAEQLYRLITDEKLVHSLREAASGQISKFRWDEMAQRTLRIYQSVLEKRR